MLSNYPFAMSSSSGCSGFGIRRRADIGIRTFIKFSRGYDMNRYVVVAVIFFLPMLASAADWQVVANTKLGQLRLDKAGVAMEGKFTKAVLVYEFNDTQKVTSPPYDVFNRRQDDVLVDCSNPSLGIITSRFFEGEKLVSTFELKTADVKFSPPAPDTMAEAVVIAVCAAALATKP